MLNSELIESIERLEITESTAAIIIRSRCGDPLNLRMLCAQLEHHLRPRIPESLPIVVINADADLQIAAADSLSLTDIRETDPPDRSTQTPEPRR